MIPPLQYTFLSFSITQKRVLTFHRVPSCPITTSSDKQNPIFSKALIRSIAIEITLVAIISQANISFASGIIIPGISSINYSI